MFIPLSNIFPNKYFISVQLASMVETVLQLLEEQSAKSALKVLLLTSRSCSSQPRLRLPPRQQARRPPWGWEMVSVILTGRNYFPLKYFQGTLSDSSCDFPHPEPDNRMNTGRRVIQKIFSNLQKYSENDGQSGEEEGNRLMRHLAALPCFLLVYRPSLCGPLCCTSGLRSAGSVLLKHCEYVVNSDLYL